MTQITINKLKKILPKGTVEVKAVLWSIGHDGSSMPIENVVNMVKELKKEYKGITNFRLKVDAPEIYYESDACLAEISIVGDRPETPKEYIFRLKGQLLAHKEYCMKQNRKCIHGW